MRKLQDFKKFQTDASLSKNELRKINGGLAIQDASKYSCSQETCVDNCSDIRYTITRDHADGTITVDTDNTTMFDEDCGN